jgi:hypothetical protein
VKNTIKQPSERWWRWPVYFIAAASALFASYYAWVSIMAGGALGWSGRSDLQVAEVIMFLILLPLVLTGTLSLMAINAAHEHRRLKAVTFCLCSVLPVPAVFALESMRALPF